MARIEVNGLCGFVFDDGADAPAVRTVAEIAPSGDEQGDLPTPGMRPGAKTGLLLTEMSRKAIGAAHGPGLGYASGTLRRSPPMGIDIPDWL